MKIAAAQIACAPGEIGANLRKIRDFVARARKSGADLIVFPEMSDTGYSMPAIKQHATAWSEGAVPRLEQLAEELSIAIICGVSERDGDTIYNAQVFIEAGGEMVGTYRKTHLVTAAPLDVTKNGRDVEVPPPGAGLKTLISIVPTNVSRPDGMMAVRLDGEL